MKWQRARIVRAADIPHIKGRTCWVRATPPRMLEGFRRAMNGVLFVPTDAVYDLNLRMGAVVMVIMATAVELLPDFADDVPLQSFAEWEAGEEVTAENGV